MIPCIGLLLALGASALVAASPVSDEPADDIVSSIAADLPPNATESDSEDVSYAFRLYAHAPDKQNHLASAVHGMYLNGYHFGAGINKGVLHAVDDRNHGNIFYLNHRPGHQASILTDSGGFPYSLVVPPPSAPGEKEVLVAVGNAGSPVSISGKFVLVEQLAGQGTFIACRRTVSYYSEAPLIMLHYSFGGAIPHDCIPIKLALKCAHLPMTPVNHHNAQKVQCSA